MFKTVSKLLALVVLFSLGTVQAHIHTIEKWSNGSQELYCLKDRHNSLLPHNQVSDQQRFEIVDSAKKLNACVIVEDAILLNFDNIIANPSQFDPNENYIINSTEKQAELDKLNPDTPPIGGLTCCCHLANVPVDNVEFRQIKMISMNYGFIDSKTALNNSIKIKNQILNYNDSSSLNAYYREKINEYTTTIFNPCTHFFNQLRKYSCPLQEALPLVPYDYKLDRIYFLHGDQQNKDLEVKKRKTLVLYDTLLLDLRIIHSIYTHQKHSVIFLCAGGGHIERIKPALQLMGFAQKDHYELTREQDTEPTALNINYYFTAQLQAYDTTHPLPSFIYAFINVFMRLFWW